MPRILFVEDELAIQDTLKRFFSREGHDVHTAQSRTEAVELHARFPPDVVVLDVMLPGADGFDVLRELRPGWQGPVLMLTARGDAFDQVSGLEMGADGYVVKPVPPRLLVARVKALIRRSKPARSDSAPLDFGNLRIIPSAREARADGRPIPLTDAEYDLLWFLARHAGQVVDRDALFKALRGIEYDGLDRSMDLRVSKLRAHLRDHLGGEGPIRTVHGRGYLFAVDG